MSKEVIKLEKEICEKIYNDCKQLIKPSGKTEPLLDNKLILDIFSRDIALYVFEKYPFDDNEFKLVITFVNNEKVDLSVGTIKKNINEEATLVYGVIN